MKFWFYILFLVFSANVFCQEIPAYSRPYRVRIVDGDTILIAFLPEVPIFADRIFRSEKQRKQYDKLKRNVKKVYPYALLAEARIKEYDLQLQKIPNESDRKKFMKEVEKKLKVEFEKDLKNLTFSQGKLLIKLIDRQTDKTSYELVKQYRGSFSAFMWQSLARMFGANLKTEYDPEGEDKKIEEIIYLIEIGEL
jgi:hypothetical protein